MQEVIPKDELLLFEEKSQKLYMESLETFEDMSLEEKLLVNHPIMMSDVNPQYKGDISIRVSTNITDIHRSTRRHSKTNYQINNINVNPTATAQSVIEEILKRYSNPYMKAENYLLKIADREEYLVSVKPVEIMKFQYINYCMEMNTTPNLILVTKRNLEDSNKTTRKERNSRTLLRRITNANSFKQQNMRHSLFIYIHEIWNIHNKTYVFPYEDLEYDYILDRELNSTFELESLKNYEHTDFLYAVKITSIEFPVTCYLARDQKVVVVACLYHGEKTLCPHQYREWSSNSSGCEVVFPIEIWNLPRMARLSFGLIVVKQSVLVKDSTNYSQKEYIGWGNLMIYDQNSVIKCEELNYRLWSNVRHNLNPTGSVYSNPDLVTPILTMHLLPKLTKLPHIAYPPLDILISDTGHLVENDIDLTPTTKEEKIIKKIVSMSSIDDIMEDEQNILWKYRYHIRNNYQESLPKILNSRPWNKFETIAKMQHVALGWPVYGNTIMTLLLLGSDCPDCEVRLIASKSLSMISWKEFSLYLPQICQCLKYESYLNSNMIQMLLQRMISNSKIAQSMFYYMRVEMSSCEWCKVPFSTILYNYLLYFPNRCASLLKQFQATNELKRHNMNLMRYHNLKDDRKAAVLKKFQEDIGGSSKTDRFDNLDCPLDCNIHLKTLKPESSKFMDSKMRPIRLCWNISPEFSKDYMLIYKNGDDLRQDALIVQIMHIMDSIWQLAGLDLKLHPYDVLACSDKDGYIQVVQNSETLANIFKSTEDKNHQLFFNWLKQNNHGRDLRVVVKNFTSSCAAYCIATFILGIGDRHSDNIMIRKDGHLFHIDYGHILGNFKKIFGLPREWTKFILVKSFLEVIAQGDVQKEQDFKHLCCRGYLALRKHSNLFLTLFKSMINAGIPEISNMEDLNYLKETLKIGKSEDEARVYFQSVYDNTRKKEKFISLNWFAHEKRRNNN